MDIDSGDVSLYFRSPKRTHVCRYPSARPSSPVESSKPTFPSGDWQTGGGPTGGDVLAALRAWLPSMQQADRPDDAHFDEDESRQQQPDAWHDQSEMVDDTSGMVDAPEIEQELPAAPGSNERALTVYRDPVAVLLEPFERHQYEALRRYVLDNPTTISAADLRQLNRLWLRLRERKAARKSAVPHPPRVVGRRASGEEPTAADGDDDGPRVVEITDDLPLGDEWSMPLETPLQQQTDHKLQAYSVSPPDSDDDDETRAWLENITGRSWPSSARSTGQEGRVQEVGDLEAELCQVMQTMDVD